MFGIEWSELAVIAVVALVVIGPKDLPKALRTLGIWVRKARAISREFQSSVEQMIREAELDEVRREIEQASRTNLQHELEKAIDPKGELAEALKPPVMPSLTEPSPAPAVAPPAAAAPAAAVPTPAAAAETPPQEPAPHHHVGNDAAAAAADSGSPAAPKNAAGN